MKALLKRLNLEAEELEDKLDKIFAFIDGDIFDSLDDEDQRDIEEQSAVMSVYLDIVRRRIENYTNKTNHEHY